MQLQNGFELRRVLQVNLDASALSKLKLNAAKRQSKAPFGVYCK